MFEFIAFVDHRPRLVAAFYSDDLARAAGSFESIAADWMGLTFQVRHQGAPVARLQRFPWPEGGVDLAYDDWQPWRLEALDVECN